MDQLHGTQVMQNRLIQSLSSKGPKGDNHNRFTEITGDSTKKICENTQERKIH